MKRLNVQDAFAGEGNPHQEGVRVAETGDEAVELKVVSGRVLVVVPAGTADGDLFEYQERVLGELVLEDGTTLSFTIEDGATGAYIGVSRESQGKGSAHHGGLSSIDVPSTS
ncbi:MAG TPA: hypothetical protein VHS99_05730 [Chloroflexota bacterium]|nr:hypothetical protein [Chloroflexota bacterium]